MADIQRRVKKELTLSKYSLYEIHLASGISQVQLETMLTVAKAKGEIIVFHIQIDVIGVYQSASRG